MLEDKTVLLINETKRWHTFFLFKKEITQKRTFANNIFIFFFSVVKVNKSIDYTNSAAELVSFSRCDRDGAICR